MLEGKVIGVVKGERGQKMNMLDGDIDTTRTNETIGKFLMLKCRDVV